MTARRRSHRGPGEARRALVVIPGGLDRPAANGAAREDNPAGEASATPKPRSHGDQRRGRPVKPEVIGLEELMVMQLDEEPPGRQAPRGS